MNEVSDILGITMINVRGVTTMASSLTGHIATATKNVNICDVMVEENVTLG